jgi:hypothetical protein
VTLGPLGGLVHLVGLGVHTEVELLGGAGAPARGYLYEFGVYLDGQLGTLRFWDYAAGGSWTGRDCVDLDDTVITSSDDTIIELDGASLEVLVRVNITTAGDFTCDEPTSFGPLELRGSFTMAQLASAAPLVLSTPAGSPLDVRVTLSADEWRPAG